ncbi:HAD family phosphatase [Plantactinospora sp. KBS50]|uniref:HAD family hydrolase n=1 Tax=Plantactinospora sp. KBS50 TaxID=2024580 RepID=UPI000BAB1BE0|nr:HAD family phosphatase [Plantactinospora sp. KBS50]ASW53312.1 HAD family hydrolase [Plantactinospora sp. KBS50]
MTDAVIFDLDGVIVDSEPVWEEVRRAYVDRHGGRWQPDSQRRLMGMSTGEWAAYLSGELGVQRSPEQVATEVVDEMTERYAAHVPLIAGAVQVVRRLAGRWPLGLASSSPPRLIDAALAAAGVAGEFRATLSTERVPRGKPAPDVYLAVAQRLGAHPSRCVAIEDSSNGVRSAAAAGMRVIAVPHGAYPLDPDVAARTALTIGRIDELTVDAVAALLS